MNEFIGLTGVEKKRILKDSLSRRSPDFRGVGVRLPLYGAGHNASLTVHEMYHPLWNCGEYGEVCGDHNICRKHISG